MPFPLCQQNSQLSDTVPLQQFEAFSIDGIQVQTATPNSPAGLVVSALGLECSGHWFEAFFLFSLNTGEPNLTATFSVVRVGSTALIEKLCALRLKLWEHTSCSFESQQFKSETSLNFLGGRLSDGNIFTFKLKVWEFWPSLVKAGPRGHINDR